jgi:zinc transporter 2
VKEHEHKEHDHDHKHTKKHNRGEDKKHDLKKRFEVDDENDFSDEHEENRLEIKEGENYNLRAAMIHILGDLIQSIGVLIAALLIYFLCERNEDGQVIYTGIQLTDPCCTYLFSILVMFTTVGIAKDCVKVLMEGTP